MGAPVPRVVAVGGSNSPELSNNRSGAPLEHVCGLFGYETTTYPVQNLNAFRRTIKFIGSVVRLPEFEGSPLFVHISVDGNPSGLEIGPDTATWEQLILMISDLLRDLESYSAPVTLVLSARGAHESDLTGLLLKHCQWNMRDGMFVFVDRVPRRTDAILAWAHFYGEATDIDFAASSDAVEHSIHRLRSRMRRLGLDAPAIGPRADCPRAEPGVVSANSADDVRSSGTGQDAHIRTLKCLLA